MIKNDWSLHNLPPEKDADTAEFFWSLYEHALAEQERLQVRERALQNHALYRNTGTKKGKAHAPVNLFFSNVDRTVSNITASNPSAEVVDEDGQKDGSEEILTIKLRSWWKETHQRRKHKSSARKMEIYGCTTEKPFWDPESHRPDISVMDLFSVTPAPGVYEDWGTEMPYVCFLYADYVAGIEQKYDVKGVAEANVFDLLGESREAGREVSASMPLTRADGGNYASAMHRHDGGGGDAKQFPVGLVVEIWIRGAQGTVAETNEVENPETGEILIEKTEYPKYPDGIRKVTITRATHEAGGNRSVIVLDDAPNPNLNYQHAIEDLKNTYPWGRLPTYKADSYQDEASNYGFSAAEQVGDLLRKIEQLFSRLFAYARQALSPALIIEKYCGITQEMIENQAGNTRLILMPSKPHADIRYLETPNLPQTFFAVLDLFLKMFDRIYQIEDADRGMAPRGITAASAIVALQERNAVLIQSKINSAESLCGERGMWAIGLWQNFGVREEFVETENGPAPFRGIDYAGRRLSYSVEVGSTIPKTSLQVEEQVRWLASMRLVDLRTILETINFPNRNAIIERNGESQLDMAMNILIDAGLPKEEAVRLKQFLIQPQGGPGDKQPGGSVQPGMPRAAQGQAPPQSVTSGAF